MDGGITQAVEFLLCKHEALSLKENKKIAGRWWLTPIISAT
jgi:uncharacterized protein YggL (DUF469 family)